jgi:hypothetical protein
MRIRAAATLFVAAALGLGCGRSALEAVAVSPTGDLAQTLSVEPGEILVKATGIAAGADTAAADQATRQALRRAVEQAFGANVEAELSVQHRRVVRERITSRTEGFVRTYRVLSQGFQDGATVVTIEAVVNLGAIKDEVAAIRRVLEEKRMPRMLVLMGPQGMGAVGTAVTTAQNAVEQAFQSRGFRLVQINSPTVAESVYTAFEQNEAQAVAQVGKTQGAEVVLVGSAQLAFDSDREVYGQVAKFYKPTVALRAVEADTGRVLFSDQKTGIATAKSDALAAATTELAERAVEAIVKGWQHETRNAEVVVVTVAKVTFTDFARIKRMVEGVRGVQIVRTRPFAGDRGEYEVEYVGDPAELAEALTQLPEMPLTVGATSGQTVLLEKK